MLKRATAFVVMLAIVGVSSLPTVPVLAGDWQTACERAQAMDAMHGGHPHGKAALHDLGVVKIECGCGCHMDMDGLPHLLAPTAPMAPAMLRVAPITKAPQAHFPKLVARARASLLRPPRI